MRFVEINEIWEWCAERGIALEDDARPADDPQLSRRERRVYADGRRSGREAAVAADVVRALGARGPWGECLVWITLVGVWPSGEDWPAFYAWRGARGERRSVEVAPGCVFEAAEAGALAESLTMVLENAWDAYVLPAGAGAALPVRARISHDEWVELQGEPPVDFGVAAV